MFKLLQSNPGMTEVQGYHMNQRVVFKDSKFENQVLVTVSDVFERALDKSPFGSDFENHLLGEAAQRNLSSAPFNYLQTLDLSNVQHALDLSDDFGTTSHFLSDLVKSVESIKTDQDLARLSARRCHTKTNVCFVLSKLDKIALPAAHYDLIILGRLENHQLDESDLTKLLARLKPALSPRGVLLVNAQNQNRLSCQFSPQVNINENGPDYADLYLHTPSRLDSRAVTLYEFRKLALNLGYPQVDVHGTFSVGDDYSNLFSEDYLTSAVDPLNHFYRNSSLSRDDLSEYLIYRQLVSNKQPLINFASRYLFLLGSHAHVTRAVYDNDFSHYSGLGRKPQWRTNTVRARADVHVRKIPKHPNEPNSSNLIAQDTSDQNFQKGSLLVNDWLDAVVDNNADALSDHVVEYKDWLENLATKKDEFQRTAYDLLPFNILVTQKKDQRIFKTIDPEWQLKTDLSAEFVLFRALFWFAFENKALLRGFAEQHQLFSIGAFIIHFSPNLIDPSDLQDFIVLEEKVQAEIEAHFTAGAVRLAVEQAFDSQSIPAQSSVAQGVWIDAKGKTNQANLGSAKVLKIQELQTIELMVGPYSKDYPHLRVDPLSSMGAFRLVQLKICKQDGTQLSLYSGAELLANAELKNIQLIPNVDSSNAESALMIAVNDDPHLVIKLAAEKALAEAAIISIDLQWAWDEYYSSALTVLSQELSNRNRSLMHQLNSINTLEFENRYKQLLLDNLTQHEHDQRQRAIVAEEHFAHLRRALDDQRSKNDELYQFLLARPSTRARAFMSRMVSKVLRKPIVEVDTDLFKPPPPPPKKKRLADLLGQSNEDYGLWVSENDLSPEQLDSAKQEIENMPYKPVFSILVPIYNTDPAYLIPMIRSVQSQIYPHWQLCLVDDCSPKGYLRNILEFEAAQDDRISIRLNHVNQGISVTTNDALAMATGDYIALLDHDDELSVDALYHNAKAILQDPDIEMLYSDEDKMDVEGNRLEPFFKPDFSQDMLETNNYVCHFTVIKKSIMDQIGGFREGLDGSQDHDVILRASDAAKKVHHIQRILYHWRKIPGSTAVVYDAKSYAWEAGRKSIEDLLRKRETGVRVEFGSLKGSYRVFREIKGEPLISIIIPFKDKPELLRSCLNSVLNRTSYRNFEVIGVSNNSQDPETTAVMNEFSAEDSRVKFVEHNVPFNFSEVCNYGVSQSKGEYLVLLNNDIEIISSDWLERLLEHAQRPEIGAVGGKLLYPDGRIQHAGIVVGMVGAAGHPHKFFPDHHIGYHGRLHMVYNVSAVTGAMLMVSREKYEQVAGLDADQLAVAYNDVDFCLKLMDAGYTNLFTPHCKATHHESLSRGYEDTPEKLERLLAEQKVFLERWADFISKGDPFYNPNLSLKSENFSLNFRD